MIDAGFVDSLRLGGGDVHGDVVSNFIVAANNVNNGSDLGAAVHILVQLALSFETLEATEGHVFADLANESRTDFFEGLAVNIESRQSSDVSRVLFGNQTNRILGHLLEFFVLGNEVGFRVDFKDGADLAVFAHVNRHNAFSRHAGSGLAGLVAELDAKDLFCLGGVTVSFREGLLAFHHRGVGLFAKRLNHCGSNSGHSFSSYCLKKIVREYRSRTY